MNPTPEHMNPTPEQALRILDQAAANVAASRQDHANLQLAVSILNDFIKANTPKEAKP